MAIKTFPLRFRWAKMLTSEVKHLAFEKVDQEDFNFIPGQFISIHFEWEDKLLRRSYSVATVPGKSDLIEFSLSFVPEGAASQFLFNLKEEDTINVSGPYGRLILRDEMPQRYLLAATGTGVTPYRSMLPELSQRLTANPDLTVELLLGVRTREDALYEDEFLEFAQQHSNFNFHLHLSREALTEPKPHEKKGYVQSGLKELHLDPKKDIIYLCGNPNMIDEAVVLTKEFEFPIQQVRREKYVS